MNEEYTQPHIVWEGTYNSHQARIVQQLDEVYVEILDVKDRLGNRQWRSYTISEDLRLDRDLNLRHLILQICGTYKEEK